MPLASYPTIELKKLSWPAVKLSFNAIFHQHPEIKPLNHPLDDYDLIIFGVPVWANNVAPPMNTVFAENTYEHKNTAVLVTALEEQDGQHAIKDARYKLVSRGATMIGEKSIAIKNIDKETIISEALQFGKKLSPLVRLREREPEEQATS